MQVILIRHGRALDRREAKAGGTSDTDRPLTRPGRRRMKQAARGLVALVPQLDLIASSPLVRAIQTADLVLRAYHRAGAEPPMIELPELAPAGTPQALLAFLVSQEPSATLALVGHEPLLGRAVTFFATGRDVPAVAMKKGGVAIVEFAKRVAPGRGRISRVMHASDLRRIG